MLRESDLFNYVQILHYYYQIVHSHLCIFFLRLPDACELFIFFINELALIVLSLIHLPSGKKKIMDKVTKFL